MPDWWSWDAANAIATFLAVMVALFWQQILNWWTRPKIELRVYTRKDLGVTLSKIFMSISNRGGPIKDAQVILIAASYLREKDKDLYFERIVPQKFCWVGLSSEQKITIHSKEVFELLFTAKSDNSFWRPKLSTFPDEKFDFYNIAEADPNFKFTVYLQVKGENYSSDIFPIKITADIGSCGGWVVSSSQSICKKRFDSLVSVNFDDYFSGVTRRLNP